MKQPMELNAVFVKEIRQITRSRFGLALMIFLLIMEGLGAMGTLLFSSQISRLMGYLPIQLGTILAVMVWLLLGTALAASCLDVHGRTWNEWRPSHHDTLFTTTLKPGPMLWGKLLANLVMLRHRRNIPEFWRSQANPSAEAKVA